MWLYWWNNIRQRVRENVALCKQIMLYLKVIDLASLCIYNIRLCLSKASTSFLNWNQREWNSALLFLFFSFLFLRCTWQEHSRFKCELAATLIYRRWVKTGQPSNGLRYGWSRPEMAAAVKRLPEDRKWVEEKKRKKTRKKQNTSDARCIKMTTGASPSLSGTRRGRKSLAVGRNQPASPLNSSCPFL